MKKNSSTTFAILALFVVVIVVWTVLNKPAEETIHYHAGFQVYVNNKLQDFSGQKYMSAKPCGDHDEIEHSAEDIQNEKAHLHDQNGDVEHTHEPNAVWGDLFKNIDYKFPSGAMKTYVNGELYNDDILKKPIVANESVVIFVGTNTDIDKKLAGAITKTRILEIENKSEDCGIKK